MPEGARNSCRELSFFIRLSLIGITIVLVMLMSCETFVSIGHAAEEASAIPTELLLTMPPQTSEEFLIRLKTVNETAAITGIDIVKKLTGFDVAKAANKENGHMKYRLPDGEIIGFKKWTIGKTGSYIKYEKTAITRWVAASETPVIKVFDYVYYVYTMVLIIII